MRLDPKEERNDEKKSLISVSDKAGIVEFELKKNLVGDYLDKVELRVALGSGETMPLIPIHMISLILKWSQKVCWRRASTEVFVVRI